MQSNAAMVDPRPNPRFVSHIEPIFTQQYGREQQLLESNRAVEAERQRRAKLAKQSIIVYAWREVSFIWLIPAWLSPTTIDRTTSRRLSMSCKRGSPGRTLFSLLTS
jgi:hypothetical protein